MGAPMELHSKRNAHGTTKETKVEEKTKAPTKGKVKSKSIPKSPTQPEPQISCWADLADEEDPLGPKESHSKDQSIEWRMVSKKKKNFQDRNSVMT
jgi:hypothetical protein